MMEIKNQKIKYARYTICLNVAFLLFTFYSSFCMKRPCMNACVSVSVCMCAVYYNTLHILIVVFCCVYFFSLLLLLLLLDAPLSLTKYDRKRKCFELNSEWIGFQAIE